MKCVKLGLTDRLAETVPSVHSDVTHTFVSYFLRGPTLPYFPGCPNLRQSLMTIRLHGVRTSSATTGSVSEVLKNPSFTIFYTDQNSVSISNFSYAHHLCQNKPDPGHCIQSSRSHIQFLSLSLLHIIRLSPKRCLIFPNTTPFTKHNCSPKSRILCCSLRTRQHSAPNSANAIHLS